MTPFARPATLDDTAEIVRLAGVMYASMGMVADDRWRDVATSTLAGRLGKDVAGFVVDQDAQDAQHADGVRPLASSGLAVISNRLPGPRTMTGEFGYIQWVATDPAMRRRGCARAVMTALLAWLDERGIRSVELHATAAGDPLYRSLGFSVGPHAGLRRRR